MSKKCFQGVKFYVFFLEIANFTQNSRENMPYGFSERYAM